MVYFITDTMHLCWDAEPEIQSKVEVVLACARKSSRKFSVIWSLLHSRILKISLLVLWLWWLDLLMICCASGNDNIDWEWVFADSDLLLFPNNNIHKNRNLQHCCEIQKYLFLHNNNILSFLCLPFQFQFKESLFCKFYFSAFFWLLLCVAYFRTILFIIFSGLLEFIKLCARKIILCLLFFYNILFLWYIFCCLLLLFNVFFF